MTKEHRPISLGDPEFRVLRIDRKDFTPPLYRDRVIEIVPYGGAWLLDRQGESEWEAVSQVVEGQLQGIELSLTDTKKDYVCPFRRVYGMEQHAVSDDLARFLAYVTLIDEYRLQKEGSASRIEQTRTLFDEKKQKLNQDKTVKKKYAKKLALVSERDEQIRPYVTKQRESQAFEDALLKKAILDIFSSPDSSSQSGFTLTDLPKYTDMMKKSMNADQFTGDVNLRERQPVEYFLDRLIHTMVQTKDADLFLRYRYRETPQLISKSSDCVVLDACLRFVLDSASFSSNADSRLFLERLGYAWLTFLNHRAGHISRYSQEEAYPYLSLMHDILTAAFYRSNPLVLRGMTGLIDSQFSNQKNTAIAKEATRMETRRGNDAYGMFQQTNDLLSTIQAEDDVLPILDTHMVQLETRLSSGFRSLGEMIALDTGDIFARPSAVLQEINRTVANSTINVEQSLRGAVLLINSLNESAGEMPFAQVYHQHGITADLYLFITLSPMRVRQYVQNEEYRRMLHSDAVQILTAPHTVSKAKKIEQLREITAHIQDFSSLEFISEFFLSYLSAFWHDIPESRELLHRQKEWLWDQALNWPDWFVTPRGDKISLRTDKEMEEHGMTSITFYPDRTRPRDHRVSFRFEGVDRPIDLWVTKDQQITTEDGYVFMTDPDVRPAFEQFLLKRLYYITSGILSNNVEKVTRREFEGGPSERFVRAHYMYLQAETERRKITMESDGAKTHAEDIKRDYGINIFYEMKRRWKIGSLLPTQFLSFRREQTPTVVARNVTPNEILFDPSLIVLPV